MLPSLLWIAHLIGLALGVGCATTKLVLLLKTRVDHALVPVYLKVAGPITRLILVGTMLLTLSGIGWLVLGYPITPRLIAKLVLVAAIFVTGATLDKVIEPKFRRLAPVQGAPTAPAFTRAHAQYLASEIAATLLFYATTVYWCWPSGASSTIRRSRNALPSRARKPSRPRPYPTA